VSYSRILEILDEGYKLPVLRFKDGDSGDDLLEKLKGGYNDRH
jgi:hypothetical protein